MKTASGVAAVLGLLASMVLGACGSGSTPSVVAGATSAPGGATLVPGGATSAPATAAGSGPGLNACAMFTDAEIEQITGFKPIAQHPGQEFGKPGDHCEWDLNNSGAVPWSVSLGVYTPGGRDYYDRYFVPEISGGTAADGIGDAAVIMDAGSIVAVRADTMIDLQYIEFPDRPQVKFDLAKAVLAKV